VTISIRESAFLEDFALALPSSDGQRGRPFRDHRQVVEGIIYRFRSGTPWRDLAASFGPWQRVWKRHRRFSADGTWDRIYSRLLVEADNLGQLVWGVSVDSTINRAHQHVTNLARSTGRPQWRGLATRYDCEDLRAPFRAVA
jgi:transposase